MRSSSISRTQWRRQTRCLPGQHSPTWLRARTPVHEEAALWVRINACDTPWHADDLSIAALPGVAGVILPKAEDDASVGDLLSAGARAVLPLIESAAGFDHLAEIAGADGVERLAFGIHRSAGRPGHARRSRRRADCHFRSRIVLASRLAGIAAPLDGVTTSLDDADRIRVDVLRARRLGFGGKLCIHPRQVEPVRRHFAPSEAEIDWARRVIAADTAVRRRCCLGRRQDGRQAGTAARPGDRGRSRPLSSYTRGSSDRLSKLVEPTEVIRPSTIITLQWYIVGWYS